MTNEQQKVIEFIEKYMSDCVLDLELCSSNSIKLTNRNRSCIVKYCNNKIIVT